MGKIKKYIIFTILLLSVFIVGCSFDCSPYGDTMIKGGYYSILDTVTVTKILEKEQKGSYWNITFDCDKFMVIKCSGVANDIVEGLVLYVIKFDLESNACNKFMRKYKCIVDKTNNHWWVIL